jgi:hypothetical protein
MSLDVYLDLPIVDKWTDEEADAVVSRLDIFDVRNLLKAVRQHSRAIPEVFQEEVLEQANRIGLVGPRKRSVYSANITHNLNKMADAASIYMHLWRPEEIGITKAAQLVIPLREGITRLNAEPVKFRQYNAPNGWGLYEHFVPFVEQYLAACEKNPDADVSVSR